MGQPAEAVSIDHPEVRNVADGRGPFPQFLRIDPTHELPVIVTDRSGRVIARFAELASLAAFLSGRLARTVPARLLPRPIVEAYDKL